MITFLFVTAETEEKRNRLEDLYYEHREAVMKLALRYFENYHEAEDAVQDTFIKLNEYINVIDDAEPYRVRSFILVVARNIFVDVLRKKQANYNRGTKEKSIKKSQFNVSGTEVLEMKNKINDLPDKYREPLMLKIYYDMSDKQIADILNISHSAVRKRLERARIVMREFLKERRNQD